MDPFSISERTDRATTSLASALASPPRSMQEYAGARPDPPDRRLVQQIEALTARVEVLEKRLRSLGQCAVQQYWDGRLHLPAGKLRIAVGATRMVMDTTRFSIVVNGKEILGSAVNAPAGASLNQMGGGSGTDWKSVAAANGIENPRSMGAGTLGASLNPGARRP